MTATITDDLVTLQERHRQLADRAGELQAQAVIIRDDIAVARQDWADAVELGDDVELLASRVRLRESEAEDNQRAIEHLTALLTDLDAQISNVIAREQLADDVASYHVALAAYAGTLPDLPGSLPDAVEVIAAALTELIGEVDTARASHDRLAGMSAQLSQRAGMLGVELDVPVPPSWSSGLERSYGKESLHRQLMLACLQQRGAHAILSEIERVINIGLNDQRRAAR